MRLGLPPVHRAGWPFVALAAAAALLGFGWFQPLGWIFLILAGWIASFFRDPERVPPPGANIVVSPADGLVSMIAPAPPPAELGMGPTPLPRISVFMSVFDVHINRAPITGRVIKKAYRPGTFVNASLDKASVDNERQSLRLGLADGREIAVVQIAGLVARRILTWVGEGDAVETGARYGMIRFGSRVDVYLPAGVKPLVRVGQRMVAGETVLAVLGATPRAAPVQPKPGAAD